MLRKVRLYGQLAEFIGLRQLEAELSSVAEAVRMLIANFPAAEAHIANNSYKILVGDISLTEDELHFPVGQEDIKIVPVIAGSGGATGSIIAGAALIALSFVSFGAGSVLAGVTQAGGIFGAAATTAGAAVLSNAFFLIGASLVLGGVAQLLTPTPAIPQGPDTEQDPRKSASYSFSGVQNTSRAGTPVPIVYGKTITGSVVISAGIDTVQVKS
jgi:predicted phage tail protein